MFRELFITNTSGCGSVAFARAFTRREAGQVELFLRETPNGLGADGTSLKSMQSKSTISLRIFITLQKAAIDFQPLLVDLGAYSESTDIHRVRVQEFVQE